MHHSAQFAADWIAHTISSIYVSSGTAHADMPVQCIFL